MTILTSPTSNFFIRRFSGDESFMDDPNAFNDAANLKKEAVQAEESRGSRL
jgi:hypothetical protein